MTKSLLRYLKLLSNVVLVYYIITNLDIEDEYLAFILWSIIPTYWTFVNCKEFIGKCNRKRLTDLVSTSNQLEFIRYIKKKA